MKNILLLVHDDAGQEARLQAALDLTRASGGHLSCVDVAMIPFVATDMGSGTAQALLLQDERDKEKENRTRLESRLNTEGVSWDWTDVIGGMAQAMVDASALADIIVLNCQLSPPSLLDMRDITSRVVTSTRTLVLAMPEHRQSLSTRSALIAWDGSPSCAATLRASVPLLQQAEEVHIFTAQDDSIAVSPAAAAQYLSRHGIAAQVDLAERKGLNADDLITRAAQNTGAGYIIMGAYGRGRLREAFGGVTKRLLGNSPLPLILGH